MSEFDPFAISSLEVSGCEVRALGESPGEVTVRLGIERPGRVGARKLEGLSAVVVVAGGLGASWEGSESGREPEVGWGEDG